MNQAPTMAQPGAHIDTEPISDMSADADQISIDLSDGGESQRAGNAPAGDENQNTVNHPQAINLESEGDEGENYFSA